jgi:hypothetical protein
MTVEKTTNRDEGPCHCCDPLRHGGYRYDVVLILPLELVLCTDCFEKLRRAMNAHRAANSLRPDYSPC